MKKLLKEFKTFVSRGNVMELAVGMIIGAAFTAIISAVVNGILKPLINLIPIGETGLQTVLRQAIIAEDGTPFILDWSHATQGNASADIARTYLLFWLNGDIDGADKYLDMFCEKSGTAKQYVQKWMPIVAASQSVKSNEKEREFLLSWVDVVDYE